MTETLLNQSGYKRIEAILEERRVKARRALEIRHKRVRDTIPGFEELEFDIAAAGLKYNRALLSGTMQLKETQAELDGEINSLRLKQAELLSRNGFSEDYLAPTPECALCGDTGYITGTDGRAERCACYCQLLFNSLEAASNILSAGAAGFELFDETLYSERADGAKYKQAASPRDNIVKIRDSAKRFTHAFRGGIYENLYFFGQPGTGKTFMAASIANALMREGTPVLYLSAPNLFNMFTEHRVRSFRDEDYRDTLYKRVFSCKLLIIDDLGMESLTDSRFSEFVALLNERLASGICSTIISTNMELKELKTRYDERAFSRIVGSFRIIRFFGDDIRLKRPKTGAGI